MQRNRVPVPRRDMRTPERKEPFEQNIRAKPIVEFPLRVADYGANPINRVN